MINMNIIERNTVNYATCRNFRQVVVVRFFRTTTNVFQFATQCVTNSVIRNFRTTALQFADLKNNIADHFRDLTKMIGKTLNNTVYE